MNGIFLKQSCNELSAQHKFNGIDIIKFLCAIMICMIHLPPINGDAAEIGSLKLLNFGLQNCFCRIAVPFYFTASGFLLFRKAENFTLCGNTIKGFSFKTLRLLGTWTFLLFIGGNYQLWYLGALVLAVLVLNGLIKKGFSLRFIGIVSLVLFAIGLLGDSYYGLLEPLKNFSVPRMFIEGYETVFSTTRNGLFFGFIFVFLGALFAQKRIVMNNAVSIIGLIFSLAMMISEVLLLKHFSLPKDYNMFISLLPATFFLFYLATHLNLQNKPIYSNLRIIGVLIFFMHTFVKFFVGLAIDALKDSTGTDLSAFLFLIVIILTTLIAILIERLSKKEKLRWLRYLYS